MITLSLGFRCILCFPSLPCCVAGDLCVLLRLASKERYLGIFSLVNRRWFLDNIMQNPFRFLACGGVIGALVFLVLIYWLRGGCVDSPLALFDFQDLPNLNGSVPFLETSLVSMFITRYKLYYEMIRPLAEDIDFGALRETLAERRQTCGTTRVAICAFVRNEERFLREWIVYHLLIGVSHFFVYDNNSTDRTWSLMDELEREGYITREKVPGSGMQQRETYNRCVHDHLQEADWFAVIDSDEFLNMVNETELCLGDFMARYQAFASVHLQWAMFYTDDVVSYQDRSLILENHHERFYRNLTKAIHNSKYIKPITIVDIHGARDGITKIGPTNETVQIWVSRAAPVVNVYGKPTGVRISNGQTFYGFFQLNHYFSRSFEEYLLKCARGSAIDTSVYSLELLWEREAEPKVLDESIQRIVPLLREILYPTQS
jgi:hypothetical protein